MAYYDALKAKWPTLTSTTTDAKLAEINALTVPGSNVDVPVASVVGKLMLSGAYLALAQFAAGAPTNDVTHDTALGAAKMVMTIITIPNAPAFQMSDATIFAEVKALMDALLAQEVAVPNSTGFTQTVHDSLLALATSTQPWATATSGGALNGPVTINELIGAGGLS